MRVIPVQEAVGHVLRQDNISTLLDLGKHHLYVHEHRKIMLHENEAALRIARAVAGDGLEITEPTGGMVSLLAARKGLMKVRTDVLEMVNEVGPVILTALHNNQDVDQGRVVARIRIIPLIIEKKKVEYVEKICFSVCPIVSI